MAKIIADRVLETTTTTGTGDITLAAAVTGYRRFSAVCATNDVVDYSIVAVDASGVPTGDWEVGFGTYSAANTLTRTLVRSSSNANAAVAFAAGTKQVALTVSAASIKRRGALVTKSADQTGANYTGGVILTWNSEDYDTDAFHDNVTNNTRLTIPVGVTKVRLSGGMRANSNTSDTWGGLGILKNGSAVYTGGTQQYSEIGTTNVSVMILSAILDVVAGDYFELQFIVESDTTVDVIAQRSWFSIEVIE